MVIWTEHRSFIGSKKLLNLKDKRQINDNHLVLSVYAVMYLLLLFVTTLRYAIEWHGIVWHGMVWYGSEYNMKCVICGNKSSNISKVIVHNFSSMLIKEIDNAPTRH
ncbi:hypothetical protein GQX74_004123 [Glossina fuscipes]|nr:hypothetical protein GQX74_004123 [Glossina fuscipes]